MLWRTHKTGDGHAHLTCGPRAFATKTVLDKLDIQNRAVVIFSDDYPQVESHTFLEVFNKETGRWQLQDPAVDLPPAKGIILLIATSLELS